MRNKTTAAVEVHIDELMELVSYCNKMANSIPEDMYNDPTMAGTTFGQTVQEYRNRAEYFYNILSRVWPK
jgi:hypothetical protein